MCTCKKKKKLYPQLLLYFHFFFIITVWELINPDLVLSYLIQNLETRYHRVNANIVIMAKNLLILMQLCQGYVINKSCVKGHDQSHKMEDLKVTRSRPIPHCYVPEDESENTLEMPYLIYLLIVRPQTSTTASLLKWNSQSFHKQ